MGRHSYEYLERQEVAGIGELYTTWKVKKDLIEKKAYRLYPDWLSPLFSMMPQITFQVVEVDWSVCFLAG